MFETVLNYALTILHGAAVLVFGVFITEAFVSIPYTKQSLNHNLIFCGASGFIQLLLVIFVGQDMVWKLYPLLVHLPLIVFIAIYKKNAISVIVAVLTTYLCCQPSRWFGVLFQYLTQSTAAEYAARIIVLPIVAFVIYRYFAATIADIFSKDIRRVLIFGLVPAAYYIFDYATSVYTNLWLVNNRVVVEFFPFFLVIIFFIFCVVYHNEYESKVAAEKKEHILKISTEQTLKEIETVKENEQRLRMLRHDFRFLLDNLALSIECGDTEKTLEMIKGFSTQVESTSIKKYCENDILNYTLISCANKCADHQTEFDADIQIASLETDEVMLSSIIANAIDNAINAQKDMAQESRSISLMIKTADEKLLISVSNTFGNIPVFSGGLPVSHKKGHGYGTQSIRFMTESLGGKCRFSIENNRFTLRIII